jgi:two-component system, response regulator YcbB
MLPHFYIADDDKGIQNILKGIVHNQSLGTVIGMSDNGKTAIEEIRRLKPDIVLVDLLMPQVDGIGVIAALNQSGCESSYVMISQVDSKEMVTGAYQQGIDFFISKPINVVEVITVLRNVIEKRNLKLMLQSFETAIKYARTTRPDARSMESTPASDKRNEIRKILGTLGIMGEAGCQDLLEIVHWMESEPMQLSASSSYKLTDAYQMLREKYLQAQGTEINIGTIEQRVRRAIKNALKNLANLGIENYCDDNFVKYSTILFEFGEVRREINFIKGKSQYSGKINVKKFVEGIQILLTEKTDG